MLLGDLNYDMLHNSKCTPLVTVCDIFDLKNVISTATCFMKNSTPSLLDVILTTVPNLLFHTTNFNTGISDWHHMVRTVIKGHAPKPKMCKKKCRSYKHFDENAFNADVENIPFHATYVFDDVDDIYWAHEL